jgi:hypothetical protein
MQIRRFVWKAAMRAFVVLTPSESKRLIARAVARKQEVQIAMENAYVILFEGTTTTYIAQELFGVDVSCTHFTSGLNISGVLCNSDRGVRGKFPLVAYKGELVDVPYEKALEHFHKETVIIKGANAIDHAGFIGIIVSGYTGGSISKVIGTSVSQGLRIICPVGLEKTIFSVVEAAKRTGGKNFDYAMGADFGLFVLTHADIVTELQAIRILSDADAIPVAAGGIDGSEGSVVLTIEGGEEPVRKAVQIIESIKGEPAQKGIRMKCPGQTNAAGEPSQCKYVNCTFYPRENSNLPRWLRTQKE